MITYEVGTTAKFLGKYREKQPAGHWANRSGFACLRESQEDFVPENYTDVTSPGPPLPAGTVLDPSKRYVGLCGCVWTFSGSAWRYSEGRNEGGDAYPAGTWDVHPYATDGSFELREIRKPGSFTQESRPEWDAVRSAEEDSAAIVALAWKLADDAERDADEARAACTWLADGWDAETESKRDNDAYRIKIEKNLRTELDRVRKAQQAQIKALEIKLFATEDALKNVQREASRGLQKTQPANSVDRYSWLYGGPYQTDPHTGEYVSAFTD